MIMGVMLFGFGIYNIPPLWKTHSDLVPLKGSLRSANIFIITHPNQDKLGFEHPSQSVQLIFYLSEYGKKFIVSENVGNEYYSNRLDKMLKMLRKAREITVWIDKDQLSELAPEIYQLDKDGKTIMDLESIKSEKRPKAIFFILGGLICLGLFFGLKYPEKARNLVSNWNN